MRAPSLVSFCVGLPLSLAATDQSLEEKLWRHRNLGKAFYENPATQVQAIPEFDEMTRLVPDEPKSHYSLGMVYRQAGRIADAQRELELAAGLDPILAAHHAWRKKYNTRPALRLIRPLNEQLERTQLQSR